MTTRLRASLAALATTALLAGAVSAAEAAKHRNHPGTHRRAHHAVQPTRQDTDTIQAGDQSSPDPAGKSSERASAEDRSAGESTTNDAPGGHEDPPGAETDHQFDGAE
jgi:hypothetical protein